MARTDLLSANKPFTARSIHLPFSQAIYPSCVRQDPVIPLWIFQVVAFQEVSSLTFCVGQRIFTATQKEVQCKICRDEMDTLRVLLTEMGTLGVLLTEMGTVRVLLTEIGALRVLLTEMGTVRVLLTEMGTLGVLLTEMGTVRVLLTEMALYEYSLLRWTLRVLLTEMGTVRVLLTEIGTLGVLLIEMGTVRVLLTEMGTTSTPYWDRRSKSTPYWESSLRQSESCVIKPDTVVSLESRSDTSLPEVKLLCLEKWCVVT
jgi:hypothetical protein